MEFTELIDLASERLGGAVVVANDEFFAPKENLLRSTAPVFRDGEYTDRGKWMDGWETRRRRTPGFDWCIIRLGLPGIVRGIVVDTSFFRGNYPEHCSLEAATFSGLPSEQELTHESVQWVPLLPQMPLAGDTQNPFPVKYEERVTHLRFKIYPDGGVARLRVHGEVVPDWPELKSSTLVLDLAAVENGGLVLACSDMFFGHRHNLIMPGPPVNMSDGWETKRRRGPGHDWVIIKLGAPGTIERVEVDTSHFKGNFPESCSLEVSNSEGVQVEDLTDPRVQWKTILPRTKLQAHARHFFHQELLDGGVATNLRFSIFPDGGVARLRAFGKPVLEMASLNSYPAYDVNWLNSLPADQAMNELRKCCSSKRWAEYLVNRRPYLDLEDLSAKAKEVWYSLDAQDWLEAFRSHPKIGERKAAEPGVEQARKWSSQEQSSLRQASNETLDRLSELNREYEKRFGYIFIVCATRKSPEEMLAILQSRLGNEKEAELPIAAEEQAKITELRLRKLFAERA